jgi:hypothetical protein
MDELQTLTDGWALAIGRYLLAFSACEFMTHLFIQTFGSKEMREANATKDLSTRMVVMSEVLAKLPLDAKTQKRVDVAMANMTRLSKPRNLVAHNGLTVLPFRDKDGSVYVDHVLVSARDETKGITISEIDKFAAQARELDDELAILYGAVRQPENQLGKDDDN